MGRRATAPLVLSLRYSGRCGSRKKLQAFVAPNGRPISAAPPLCLTSSAPWTAHLGESGRICILSIPVWLYSTPPRNLHSQRPLLHEAKCRACAAVSPAQDGSLVESHPYVTGSRKDREHSLANYCNGTKESIISLCVGSLPLCAVCILEQRNILWTHMRRKKSEESWGHKSSV